MEWIMPPFKTSVRPRLIKCTTNHQNWACTAQMHPREQPHPPQLATFSKPLVEIQYYSPLEKIWGLCVDSEETDRFYFFFFWSRARCQSLPTALSSTACSHPQHRMTTLAAAALAGSRGPWRSHAIMHPCSHDIRNYTKKARGCLGRTVFHVREKNNLLTSFAQGEAAQNKMGYCI